MKRYIFIATAMAICLYLIGSTYGYYTMSSKAHNVITSGAVKIAVEEWQNTDLGLIPYPEDPIAVMPGKQVSKIIKVRNLDQTCYIRASLEATVSDDNGNMQSIGQDAMEEIMQLSINEKVWKQKKTDNTWWYYSKALSKGMVTEPLLEDVIFDGENIGNDYQGCTIQIHVKAQAVQADNNGITAMEAVGWPES